MPDLRVGDERSVGPLAEAVVGHHGALFSKPLHVLRLLR